MSQPRAILVVDDDRDMLSLLDDLLSGEGYKVVKAKSGAEALEVGYQAAHAIHYIG